MVKQQKKQQQLQHNALAPQKKECDARRRQPIQMDDAICINQVKKMNTDKYIKFIEDNLNNRPQKTLNYYTPNEVLLQELNSQNGKIAFIS
jgi:hypothetical protein